MKLTARTYYLSGFAISLFAICASISIEVFLNLEPCFLCILQRISFALLTLFFLIAALHNARRYGKHLYAILLLIFTAFGGAVATRQVWLQLNPLPADAVCAPGLNYLLTTLPFSQAIKILLEGRDTCSQVTWTLLDMSMAMWSLLFFILLGIIIILAMAAKNSANLK